MRVGEARQIIGSLSFPSKMPGTGYGLPAAACKTGAKLAQIEGSVCRGCYAMKGTYSRKWTIFAQKRRLEAIRDPRWADAMAFLLNYMHQRPIKVDLGQLGVRRQKIGLPRWVYNEPGWHRWHDSGDLQSVAHLGAICRVAELTPTIRHWLPTQELAMVREYLDGGSVIPPNLVIRVSAAMVENGHHAPVKRNWPLTSSVFKRHLKGVFNSDKSAHVCPAPTQDHRCGSCRACWSPEVPHVAYAMH